MGTPFFLFTNGTSPRGLFANAYQAEAPVTGAATSVGTSTATVNGTVNPRGASVNVSFQYGTTTAYGQTAGGQATGVSNEATPFSARSPGCPPAPRFTIAQWRRATSGQSSGPTRP